MEHISEDDLNIENQDNVVSQSDSDLLIDGCMVKDNDKNEFFKWEPLALSPSHNDIANLFSNLNQFQKHLDESTMTIYQLADTLKQLPNTLNNPNSLNQFINNLSSLPNALNALSSLPKALNSLNEDLYDAINEYNENLHDLLSKLPTTLETQRNLRRNRFNDRLKQDHNGFPGLPGHPGFPGHPGVGFKLDSNGREMLNKV
jgi:uncharacterized phage infection (PIP) family protein YhgE